MKNKFAGNCTKCGETVEPGAGECRRWYNDVEDRDEWVVTHDDATICAANIAKANAERAHHDAIANTINAIMNYIKEFAEPQQNEIVHSGAEILRDSRHSHVGYTVERDDDDTIWLVWHDPTVDGFIEYSRRMPVTEDDGFGNSNADIIKALRDVQNDIPLNDLTPFTNFK